MSCSDCSTLLKIRQAEYACDFLACLCEGIGSICECCCPCLDPDRKADPSHCVLCNMHIEKGARRSLCCEGGHAVHRWCAEVTTVCPQCVEYRPHDQ